MGIIGKWRQTHYNHGGENTLPSLNPSLGEEMVPLSIKIVGKIYKILVKSSLVLFMYKFGASFGWKRTIDSEKDFKISQRHFLYYKIVDIWRWFGINSIIILIYSRFLCTTFVWKWPSGFEEDVKSFSKRWGQILYERLQNEECKKEKKRNSKYR